MHFAIFVFFVAGTPMSKLEKDQFVEAGESLTSQNRCFQMNFIENGILIISRRSGDNFLQCFTRSFYTQDPDFEKKRLTTCLSIFMHLGSALVKAARKTLMKLTPRDNFFNILLAKFFAIFSHQKNILNLKF